MPPRSRLPPQRKWAPAAGTHVDIVFVTGDAYVDHPSFAMAILHRVLEQAGFRVAILSQPDWHSCEPWRQFGRPRLFFAISAGNMDSLINHYTANSKVRNDDAYSPGGRIGLRPDRATLAVLPPGARGVSGSADHRGRRRGIAAPAGPLRLLERHRPPVDPAGLQGRPACLRHGRAARSSRSHAASRQVKPFKDLRDLRGVAYALGAREAKSFSTRLGRRGTGAGRARPRRAAKRLRRSPLLRGGEIRQAHFRRGHAPHPHQHEPVQRQDARAVPRPAGDRRQSAAVAAGAGRNGSRLRSAVHAPAASLLSRSRSPPSR